MNCSYLCNLEQLNQKHKNRCHAQMFETCFAGFLVTCTFFVLLHRGKALLGETGKMDKFLLKHQHSVETGNRKFLLQKQKIVLCFTREIIPQGIFLQRKWLITGTSLLNPKKKTKQNSFELTEFLILSVQLWRQECNFCVVGEFGFAQSGTHQWGKKWASNLSFGAEFGQNPRFLQVLRQVSGNQASNHGT